MKRRSWIEASPFAERFDVAAASLFIVFAPSELATQCGVWRDTQLRKGAQTRQLRIIAEIGERARVSKRAHRSDRVMRSLRVA